MMTEAKPLTFKVVLLGEAAVGKTSTIGRLTRNLFTETTKPTCGAAFRTHTIEVPSANEETTMVKLEIWDTAGQERYRSLAPMYYRESAAAVIVYDITLKKTLSAAQSWVDELQQSNPNTMLVLAGNKCDLDASREVLTLEADSYAKENDFLFREISAKTGVNVHELFMDIAKKLIRKAVNVRRGSGFEVTSDADQNGSTCC